jgi:hypothetical protein
MTATRLYCSMFYVDVRLRRFGGRWLASADTPDGPSLGWGWTAADALVMALEPFDGVDRGAHRQRVSAVLRPVSDGLTCRAGGWLRNGKAIQMRALPTGDRLSNGLPSKAQMQTDPLPDEVSTWRACAAGRRGRARQWRFHIEDGAGCQVEIRVTPLLCRPAPVIPGFLEPTGSGRGPVLKIPPRQQPNAIHLKPNAASGHRNRAIQRRTPPTTLSVP